MNLNLFRTAGAPLYRPSRSRTLRIDLQGFAGVSQRILRMGVRGGEHQPHIFHIWHEERGLLSQLPRGHFVTATQYLTCFYDEFTGFDKLMIHIMTLNKKISL